MHNMVLKCGKKNSILRMDASLHTHQTIHVKQIHQNLQQQCAYN